MWNNLSMKRNFNTLHILLNYLQFDMACCERKFLWGLMRWGLYLSIKLFKHTDFDLLSIYSVKGEKTFNLLLVFNRESRTTVRNTFGATTFLGDAKNIL